MIPLRVLLLMTMKTSHWAVIASILIPLANQALKTVCGHSVDVTTIDYLSIASELFSMTIGSADWIQRHIKNPADLSNLSNIAPAIIRAAISLQQPQPPAAAESVSNPSSGDTSKNLNSTNGFQFNINWSGTDSTGLPALVEGQTIRIVVPTAEIITLELRDSIGNLVLAGDVDADTITEKLARQGLSLKGKCNILINAYSKALGWGRYQTDIIIQ